MLYMTKNTNRSTTYIKLHFKLPNHNIFFTDDLRSESGIGCVIISENQDFTIVLLHPTTILLSISSKKSLIFSYSVSKFGNLLNFRDRNKHPIVKEINTLLQHSSNDVTLAWVYAYKGIAGESAEEAAKNASRHFPFPNIPVTIEYFKTYARHKFLQNSAKFGTISPHQ